MAEAPTTDTQIEDNECASDSDDGPLDPAIKDELERLNRCGEEINLLETKYTEIKRHAEAFRDQAKQSLGKLDEKIGRKRLIQAQPYYDALREQKRLEQDLVNYNRKLRNIMDELEPAREMLRYTEQDLVTAGINNELREMHQQAARKLESVVERKADIEQQIAQTRSKLGDRAARIRIVQRWHRVSVDRARPYFEKLEAICDEVARLREDQRSTHMRIRALKREYADALRQLEAISQRIHAEREQERAKRKRNTPSKSDLTPQTRPEKRPSISLVNVAQLISESARTGNAFDAESISLAIVEKQAQLAAGDTETDSGSALADSMQSDQVDVAEDDGLDSVRARLAKLNVNVVPVDVDSVNEFESDADEVASSTPSTFGDLVVYGSSDDPSVNPLVSSTLSASFDLDSEGDAVSISSQTSAANENETQTSVRGSAPSAAVMQRAFSLPLPKAPSRVRISTPKTAGATEKSAELSDFPIEKSGVSNANCTEK